MTFLLTFVAGIEQRKSDDDGGIDDVFVILSRLEVGERSGTGRRERHHLVPFIDEAFGEKLLEDPPDGLHKPRIQSLVVVVEIDPATETSHHIAPLA